MNVQGKLLFILLLGCAVLAQSAIAATIVAASDASASSKASAQYVCDGSNDQVKINSAFGSGGEVVLTEGTFRTSGTIVVKANSILRGQGPDKTVLSMAGDYAARVDIAQPGVTVSDLKITNRGWLMITTSNVKVHDVTIQDSKKTAPTVNGMFFVWADGKVCENIEFVRCKAIDVGSTGFNLNGQKSPRVNKNIKFEDCLALRCGNEGSGKIWAVGFDFHEGADLYDLYVNNCRAEDCWESGFYFEPNFYNGADPNTAIPVQVNSRVNNCISIGNGYRNNLATRFYLTGYYLSCGVTLNNCVSINNKNNGFWVWQGAKDISLNGCTDDGSDKAFQVRTGSNMRFTNCISKNPRTYALYMWGTSGAVFSNFQIVNPKKTSGAILLGLREDHPNDPWPVTGCTLDIKLSGGDPNTLIRYYNAKNNQITINGFTPVTTTTTIPTLTITPGGSPGTTNTTTPQVPPGTLPPNVGKGVIPGTIEFEDYDAGGEGKAYHETTPDNEGGATYRKDAVDIEENDGTESLVVGYCRPSEWLQYTANVTKAGTYDVWFKVASEKSGMSFNLAVDGTEKGTVSVPNTGGWNTFKEVKTQVTLTAGKHVLRVTMPTGYHNLDSMRFLPAGTTPTPTPTPVVSTPTPPTTVPAGAAIPGHIEAENYNTGGEGKAYHDVESTNLGGVYRTTEGVDIEMSSSEGSPVVGWVRPGEWLKYSVNVARDGVYDVSFRVSSAQSDSSFRMQVDGADTCTVMVPNTGSYLTYRTVVQQVSLPAGTHVIRLYFNGYTNVNWIKFQTGTGTGDINTGTTAPTPTPPAPGLPLPPPVPLTYGSGIVPGVIQAEDFNTGGEGVGYYDTTASNFGGIYRPNEDVDIELNEAANSPVVCYIRPGEWLKYTVNAKETGDYDVVFRVSSEQATTQMRLQVDGVTATTFTVPNTGGYETYSNVTQKVRLTRGPHVLRLVFGGYHNIDYMAFGTAGTLTASRAVAGVADANTTAPTPTVIPIAIAPVTVATANVTTAAMTAATTNVTTTAATVATANATTATTSPLTPTTTVTAAATTAGAMQAVTTASPTTAVTVEANAPGIPVPAVPTVANTTPKTTSAAAAITTPASMAPSPQATEGRVVSPPAMIPATTVTGTATATVTTAATTTAVANATPDATQTETTVPAKTLMEIAEADRNLTTFVNAVQRAGLTDTMNDLGPYTVFAPTDAAFEALPPGSLDALLADRDQLASVLSHHVAQGRFMAVDVTGMPAIRMLQGEPVTVKVQADGSTEIDGATVNQTDIQAGNGVIHVIDAVILPPDAIATQTATVASATTTLADATTTAMATTVDPTTVPPVTTAAEMTNGTPATR